MKKSILVLTLILAVVGLAVAQDSSHVHFTKIYRPGEAAPASGLKITYYGGPIMHSGVDVYVIYYGGWTSNERSIINTWLSHLGGTGLFNINSTYYDNASNHVLNVVNFNATTHTYVDNYSLGKNLTDANIQTIVKNAINGGHLANDVAGEYFVLTYKDVTESAFGGSFCTLYCGYHGPSTTIESGETLSYSFVGDPNRCASSCDGNVAVLGDKTSPNGNIDADGAINIMFHELSESVSDPQVGTDTAWNSGNCGENGDCCAWLFGSTKTASNGSHYNVTINSKNYLIQELLGLTGTGFTNVAGKCELTH